MTKEEFKKELESFFNWTSSRERPASSWFLSLEEWAKINFNEAYKKENEKK